MRSRPTLIFHSPGASAVPPLVRQWAEDRGYPVRAMPTGAEVEELVLRGANAVLVFDGDTLGSAGLALLQRLKSDAFTAVVPIAVLGSAHEAGPVRAWFGAGADEVITGLFDGPEQRARLDTAH